MIDPVYYALADMAIAKEISVVEAINRADLFGRWEGIYTNLNENNEIIQTYLEGVNGR